MYLLLRAHERPKQNHEDVLQFAHLQELLFICERSWTDIEPEVYSAIAYPVSKQLSTLRHGHLPEEEDGSIDFLGHERNIFGTICALSTMV